MSKRWLFAIRDDPGVWLKLHFIFSGKCTRPKQISKGILKAVSRASKASTLSISPTNFLDPAQYTLIFRRLQGLRHLHLEGDGQVALRGGCNEPPKQLRRLTYYVRDGDDDFVRSIMESSASTLEELQLRVRGDPGDTVLVTPLPRLKILRLTVLDRGLFTVCVVCLCHMSIWVHPTLR